MEIRSHTHALRACAALVAAAALAVLAPPADAARGVFKQGGFKPVALKSTGDATISGVSFEDADADGEYDGGERRFEGFRVYLDLDADGVRDADEPSTTSAANGGWSFDNLLPGTYRVRQDARGGWTCSSPDGCERAVTVATGDSAPGNDFGAWRPARILGATFEDTDHSGARDFGEPDLPRRTVYLDEDGDAVRDDGERFTVSGVDGSWALNGLRPGDWTVRTEPVDGWTCTMPADCSYAVTVRSGDEIPGHDFGSWQGVEPDEPPAEEPAPTDSFTLGEPRLRADDGDGDAMLGNQTDPATGRRVYLAPATERCLPVTVDIPVQADPGTLYSVQLVVREEDGTEEVLALTSVPESTDGLWTGEIACARDARLDLVVTTVAQGEQRRPMGELMLLDRSGVVYDRKLYASITSRGASAATARCASALQGARVTLERSDGRGFRQVASSDDGLLPAVNPQRSEIDGSYRWQVPEGRYRLRVSKPGYRTKVTRAVSGGSLLDLDIALERRPGVKAPRPRECGQPRKAEIGASGGCLTRPVRARLRGRSIRRVVFYLDGRHVKTLARPDRGGRFAITIDRRRLSAGRHVLRAKVVFKQRAQRRPAFLTLPIRRCAGAAPPKRLAASASSARCATNPFEAWVRGGRIRRVSFRIDGRRLRTVSVADWRGRYAATIDPRRLGAGRHVAAARVEFVRGSRLRARTLQLRFRTCS